MTPVYTTTFVHPWHAEWCERTIQIDVRDGRAAALRRLAASARPAILHGATGFGRGYVDLLAAGALARRGHSVLVADATWEPGSRVLDRVSRASSPAAYDAAPRTGRRLAKWAIGRLDRSNVHYGVLSRAELETFPRLWGIDRARVHFTPFCATVARPSLPAYEPGGSGVLASGNSLRDYRALLAAADGVNATVTIASSLSLPESGPDNLRIGFLAPQAHEALVRRSAVIVVPLLADTERSAGQQTYLNAMARGKPVVVTEAPGVTDYIRDGETGLVVPNDPGALSEAINGLLADPERATGLGRAARAEVEAKFTVGAYVSRLLEVADRAL
jgi:Glycosyl transferases group 1